MIAGLCESPLTFQAIIIWRDELNEGKVLLRDIIDLDATYAGPDAEAVPVIGPDSQLNFGVAIPGAGAYKRLRRLQDQDIQFQLKCFRPRRHASIRN